MGRAVVIHRDRDKTAETHIVRLHTPRSGRNRVVDMSSFGSNDVVEKNNKPLHPEGEKAFTLPVGGDTYYFLKKRR